MTDLTTILVPIRYPLTDESARTLAAAGRLAHDQAPANLKVLHVNLYQTRDKTKTTELTRAISSTLDGVEASVATRQGFLVEEEILEEAIQTNADIIVVGANQQANWRRLLRRLLQSNPEVSSFLRENTTDDTDIWEVDATTDTRAVEPA
ncbi:universal stress protein [Haloarcula nitratireducens]|uniref:Universal stress protein n=1 Tax=Haloarcula nitratireducens TaxID=2487749 RepID=A0AAW4PKU7_9EURY|nr:universal stress protein [Halomicroarcula nitratireducens]MBX0298198.1 universal stress protein [Halomicroarcula nitratireducens]